MNVEHWVHPEWAWFVLGGLAVAAAALAWAHGLARRRRRILLGPGAPRTRRHLSSDALLLLALAAIAAAWLGPRIGERVVSVPASGVDVVFAVDVSRSMDARDVPPSRLQRAQRAVDELLARLSPFDRAALVAFAGRGVLLAPLTPDQDALAELVRGLDTELVVPRSSNLGDGVRAALEAFEAGSERPRVVFVLSDGEDPSRGRDLGAAEAARHDARVLAAALGQGIGATIPDHGVPLVDRGGAVVVSRRNAERLGALAEATDGALFVADEWGVFDFDRAMAAIRRDAGAAPGARVERRVRAVRVAPLAALAFLLLLVEGAPRPRGVPRRARVPLLGAALALALGAAPAAQESTLEELEAGVRARPDDVPLLVELGAARLERGRRDAAVRAFLAAAAKARTEREAAVAYHDLGVAYLEGDALEAARDAFFDALALRPDDERARFNLEWTLRALALQPPPQEAPPKPSPPAPPEPRRADPETPEEPEPRAEPPPRAEQPAPLSEEQIARLLDRVHDDAGRSMRAAARAEEGRRPRAGAPAW